jgi:hypothetical protein
VVDIPGNMLPNRTFTCKYFLFLLCARERITKSREMRTEKESGKKKEEETKV